MLQAVAGAVEEEEAAAKEMAIMIPVCTIVSMIFLHCVQGFEVW